MKIERLRNEREVDAQVVELKRQDSDNGYVDEYDTSLEIVKRVRSEQNERLEFWRSQVRPRVAA